MTKVWMVALAMAAPLVAQTAAPANVAGVWDITGDVAGVSVVEHCTFTQADDATLAGSCDVQGAKWPTTGTVKGMDVTFTHNGKYNGDDYTIVYHGKLDKGGLTGTMDVDPFGVSGSFTAAKGTSTAAPAPAAK